MVRSLAALLGLFCSASIGCSSAASKSPEVASIVNGRCRCGDGLCVESVGQGVGASLQCVQVKTCAALSAPGRACWGSSKTAGLCHCTGSLDGLALNR